jgi:hypothetical protein
MIHARGVNDHCGVRNPLTLSPVPSRARRVPVARAPRRRHKRFGQHAIVARLAGHAGASKMTRRLAEVAARGGDRLEAIEREAASSEEGTCDI